MNQNEKHPFNLGKSRLSLQQAELQHVILKMSLCTDSENRKELTAKRDQLITQIDHQLASLEKHQDFLEYDQQDGIVPNNQQS